MTDPKRRQRILNLFCSFALAFSMVSTIQPLGARAVSHVARVPNRWTDVPTGYWARGAIDVVARTHAWMRDFGGSTFRPDRLESRSLFARALVRAFAPAAQPVEGTTFPDLPTSDPFYRYAAVAVNKGWMTRLGGNFEPSTVVTTSQVHRGLVLAVGLKAEAQGLDRLHTASGYLIPHAKGFGTLTLGMLLGLRYNHADATLDVGPKSALSRAEVAYSLSQAVEAATSSTWKISALQRYAKIELPDLTTAMRRVVSFGSRYVGYPYVWSGEWASTTTSGYCCGSQIIGGFDCSGLVWWAMKAPAAGYDNTKTRGYAGWSLPQRSSSDMASSGRRLGYTAARAGDLMFFDGDGDGIADHVNVFLGRGWALDSSDGYAGVTILWIGSGWYRDHFVGARDITGA